MPAFSRGLDGFLHRHSLRLPSFRTATREQFFQPNAVRNSRFFTSSTTRRYQYQYKSSLNQKPSVFVNNDPVLRQVVQTRQPVLVYQAPKNKWYYAKVYGVAATSIGVGLFSIKFYDNIKGRDLAFFVRPTYIVVGLSFIAIGCYVCTATTNRMRALEIMPSLHGGPMQLRLTVKAAPWTRERIIYSNLGRATISEKTEPMVQELMEADRARRQKAFEDLGHLSIPGRVWEGSARWVHKRWMDFFLRFKFAVLRFGIAQVEVQGERWKMDCSGWLLENGKAVDRLIPEE